MCIGMQSSVMYQRRKCPMDMDEEWEQCLLLDRMNLQSMVQVCSFLLLDIQSQLDMDHNEQHVYETCKCPHGMLLGVMFALDNNGQTCKGRMFVLLQVWMWLRHFHTNIQPDIADLGRHSVHHLDTHIQRDKVCTNLLLYCHRGCYMFPQNIVLAGCSSADNTHLVDTSSHRLPHVVFQTARLIRSTSLHYSRQMVQIILPDHNTNLGRMPCTVPHPPALHLLHMYQRDMGCSDNWLSVLHMCIPEGTVEMKRHRPGPHTKTQLDNSRIRMLLCFRSLFQGSRTLDIRFQLRTCFPWGMEC